MNFEPIGGYPPIIKIDKQNKQNINIRGYSNVNNHIDINTIINMTKKKNIE